MRARDSVLVGAIAATRRCQALAVERFDGVPIARALIAQDVVLVLGDDTVGNKGWDTPRLSRRRHAFEADDKRVKTDLDVVGYHKF